MKTYLLEADSVVHLAGINRPKNEEEFKEGNVEFLSEVLNILKDNTKTDSHFVIVNSS